MKTRSVLLMFAKVLVAGGCSTLAGCATTPGKLRVDTVILPYQAPDISEITGIDEDDTGEEGDATEAGSAATAPAPAPEPGK